MPKMSLVVPQGIQGTSFFSCVNNSPVASSGHARKQHDDFDDWCPIFSGRDPETACVFPSTAINPVVQKATGLFSAVVASLLPYQKERASVSLVGRAAQEYQTGAGSAEKTSLKKRAAGPRYRWRQQLRFLFGERGVGGYALVWLFLLIASID